MLESPQFNEKPSEMKGDEENGLEKTKPFHLKFYVTDHSPDDSDAGNPEQLRNLYEDIKKDGITSVRYDWRWNKIAPKEKGFDQESLVRYAQAAEIMREVGLEAPTIVLSSIPQWALDLYKTDKEKFFEEYRNYAEQVKNQLAKSRETTGETVSRIQVLNELNNTVYTPIEGEDIAKLCDMTREVFQEYNSDIKLVGTLFAGNLPQAISKATFNRVKLGTEIEEYLETRKEVLEHFDVLAIDYYPGMWHIPLGEKAENGKEIFKQLGLLQKVMEKVAEMGKEYEIGEVGIQTNIPLIGEKHNEDRQRYFYDVFFRAFKKVLLDMQERGIQLPEKVGLYEAVDEEPKNITGKMLRNLTPFPEHDMGMRKGNLTRKEILKGNRHVSKEKRAETPSQLSKIIHYMDSPVRIPKKKVE
ncbi:MAG: hypothetical protein PHV42_01225 [Candidatus Pacebacteria bacterium]|nr:hypothetical protein [Candidatus Paceibacterota bacterium]